MTRESIDDLIEAYAKLPVPAVPGRLTAEIWLESDRRRSRRTWLIGLTWQELLQRPTLALAALAVAFIAGALPVVSVGSAAHAQRARDSLHFEVFSPNSSLLLSPASKFVQR